MCNILLCNYSCGGPGQDRMDSIASWFPFYNQDQECEERRELFQMNHAILESFD
jgi:hypothetical protein